MPTPLGGCNEGGRLRRRVGGFCGYRQALKILYRTDVPVSPARKRFDVARRLRRLAQHFANPRNCVVQAVVKIDERISGPESGLELLASDNLSRTFQQDFEHSEGLAPQAQPYTVLAQFAGTDI